MSRRPSLKREWSPMVRMPRFLCQLVGALVAACSTTEDNTGQSSEPIPNLDGGAVLDTGSFGTGDAAVSRPIESGAIFLTTGNALYRFEPSSRTTLLVGRYDCMEEKVEGDLDRGMKDIASDKDGNLVGVGRSLSDPEWSLFSLNRSTAQCVHLVTITGPHHSSPVGLTFVPAGTFDPGVETLVGISASADRVAQYYGRYDLKSGAFIPISLGDTEYPFRDGDLVSLEGGTSYASSFRGTNLHQELVEFDARSGRFLRGLNPLPIGKVFGGLGFWEGTLYAFAHSGEVFTLDIDSAMGTEIGKTVADIRGAAVTTSAPQQPLR